MSNNETECHDSYSGDDHVAYIYSTDLINETNKISKTSGRVWISSMSHPLLRKK